ncbi:MAG: Uma2 family endonuclease [Microcystaceae cyanobacterium]
MVIARKLEPILTLEAFLKIPETKPASEYLNGEIYQKSMPQGEHSILQGELLSSINQIGKPNKSLYSLPELRCTFGGRSIVPDLAVFRWERIPKTDKGKIVNKFEIYPDWIIEVLSPEQSANRVIDKIVFCLKQGTELGWLLDLEDESVMVFRPNQLPDIIADATVLPVLEGLKDWQLSSQDIFAWLKI